MLGERRWRIWSCDAHLLVTRAGRTEDARRLAERRLAEVGRACDRFRPDSEIRRLPAGRPAEVSPMLAAVLRAALDTAARTDGLCDPTVGDLVRAVGYDRDIGLVLDGDDPVRVVARARASWEAVGLDGTAVTVPAGVEIDLGAVAKAFAADLIAEEIATELGCGALMNLGGDIATAGDAPDAGWQVLVQDLPDEPAAHVALHGGFSLATSSTRRRAWRRGDVHVHHIVDPRTAGPASSAWRTVSVVAPTAVEANGETTAAVVAGAAAPARLRRTGLPARLVAADGGVIRVNGWPEQDRAVA